MRLMLALGAEDMMVDDPVQLAEVLGLCHQSHAAERGLMWLRHLQCAANVVDSQCCSKEVVYTKYGSRSIHS